MYQKKNQTYKQGQNVLPQNSVACAHPGCDKRACCDNISFLRVLQHHYIQHIYDPLLGLSLEKLHSNARALQHHFGLDGGIEVARANHAIVSDLPDGLDTEQPGFSDRFNSSCALCHCVAGAFAFLEKGGLVCFPCAKEHYDRQKPSSKPGTTTIRLWSKRAMLQYMMVMGMQQPDAAMAAMEETAPSKCVVNRDSYTVKTHLSADEVRKAWVPEWEEDGKGGTQDEAFAIANGLNKNAYLSATLVNFSVEAASVLYNIRKSFASGMVAFARGVNDVGLSTLIILGGVGTGTGFHLDWTEACNVAFSVGTHVAPGTVLAVWVFINPLMLEVADAWVKAIVPTKRKRDIAVQEPCWPDGFASPANNRVHLKGEVLKTFNEYMQKEGDKRNIVNPVVVVEQGSGQMVHVPAGWAHQVTNFSPNLKVAWDFYDANNMHKYVQLQSLASKYFQGSMAKDYMSTNMIMSIFVGDA